MRRGSDRGQTTLEAALCLGPFLLLMLTAALLLWKGLGARIQEHERFWHARHALVRRPF